LDDVIRSHIAAGSGIPNYGLCFEMGDLAATLAQRTFPACDNIAILLPRSADVLACVA